jgi:beta-galactosidase
VEIPSGGATLDILIENCGRCNYGPGLRDVRKGIVGTVSLNDRKLTGWAMYGLPMTEAPAGFTPISRMKSQINAPLLRRGFFTLDQTGDTFLDMRKWGKGIVFVNGKNLGRYWHIGPQQTLYLPGCWLRRGQNEIVVFEMLQDQPSHIIGIKKPILNQLGTEESVTSG